MMKDVNWGAVILGAGAAVALLALSVSAATPAAVTMGATLVSSLGTAGAYGTAATVGATAGNMLSKLLHRAQDAGTTLIGR